MCTSTKANVAISSLVLDGAKGNVTLCILIAHNSQTHSFRKMQKIHEMLVSNVNYAVLVTHTVRTLF